MNEPDAQPESCFRMSAICGIELLVLKNIPHNLRRAGLTHAAITPMDVVKCRLVLYDCVSSCIICGGRKLIAGAFRVTLRHVYLSLQHAN